MSYRRFGMWLSLGLLLLSSLIIPTAIFASDPNEPVEEDIIPDAPFACPVTKSINITSFQVTADERYFYSNQQSTTGCLKAGMIKVRPIDCVMIRVRTFKNGLPDNVTPWQETCPKNNKFLKVVNDLLPSTQYRLELQWPYHPLPLNGLAVRD